MKKTKRRFRPMILILYLVILGIIAEGVLFAAVTITSLKKYPDTQADCVIVLGARVWPDGRVSNALQYRLEAAKDAYDKGLVKEIIVTGAQGGTEPVSEAAAGKDYLISLGVPKSAILVEDRSYDTVQNMKNAMEIMEAHGYQTALISTSDYHITRAMWITKDVGLTAYALPARSPVTPHTWVLNRMRETVSWMLFWARKFL